MTSDFISVVLLHFDGETKSLVQLPTDVPLWRITEILASKLNMSTEVEEGFRTVYSLTYSDDDADFILMDDDATLADYTVTDGDRLAFAMSFWKEDELHALRNSRVYALEQLPIDSSDENGSVVIIQADFDDSPRVQLTPKAERSLAELLIRRLKGLFQDEGITLINQQETTLEDRALLAGMSFERSIFGKPSRSSLFKSDAFMIMPFRDEFEDVYRDIVEPVFAELNLLVKRGDALGSNEGVVMNEIWSAIYNARFVVVECSVINANVYYELGIAHTLAKPAILITRDISTMPFDLRHRRHIIYETTYKGMKKLREDLKKQIEALIIDIQSRKVDGDKVQ